MKYLGLPLVSTRLSTNDCQVLLDKVHKRISSWSAKLLSYAGRLQLITSVLFQLQAYWCEAFILPRKGQKLIEAACRNYLWSGKWDTQAMALVSWEDICVPKVEGGLGLKLIKAWNKSALCKKIWDVSSRNSDLWTVWASNTLLKGQSIWQIRVPNDYSWSWRQILKARSVVKEFIKVIVGDGRHTSLFYNLWLGERRICDELTEQKIGNWGHLTTVHQWRDSTGWSIPDSFNRRFPLIAAQIRSYPINLGEDRALWTLIKSGTFTISSCYESIRIRKPRITWNNIVWEAFPRHSFILWLVVKNGLKTRELLLARGCQVDHVCCLCNVANECCSHMFF